MEIKAHKKCEEQCNCVYSAPETFFRSNDKKIA
jgi:hypothetical protein